VNRSGLGSCWVLLNRQESCWCGSGENTLLPGFGEHVRGGLLLGFDE